MTPELFEHITAIHQQVREFVEEQEPDYKVTKIDGFTTSDYQQTLASQGEILPKYADYIHTFTDVRFHVIAVRPGATGKKLSCDIRVTGNGHFHMGDRLISR